MPSLLEKLLGDPNAKELKRLQPLVDQIEALAPKVENLTDEDIRSRWTALREQASSAPVADQPKVLDQVLPEGFALIREAASRSLGMRHFPVQLLGGIVLHQGKIAEMRTGEGKTLVATLPLALNALTGRGVHLVTPNDYLAKVGAHWMGPLYEFLGLSVAAIGQQGASWLYQSTDERRETKDGDDSVERQTSSVSEDWPHLMPCSRQQAYAADITYGTNNEFGFDYLRDNMVLDSRGLVQRGLVFAIVDEVDSILIDEARTPLIISAPAEESGDLYAKFAAFVEQLKPGEDYAVEEKERYVQITEAGIKKMEVALGVTNIYDSKTVAYVHHLEEALKAKALFTRDKDYVVSNEGEVIIVDEFTGRLMHGRRYSEGLHQAIEAKEGVQVRQESRTLATITFQNLFRMYDKLAGMTGTAETEAEELGKIYNIDVVVIPTHRPIQRIDHEDVIYKTEDAKIRAIVTDVQRRLERKQPVLVGTASIEKSEVLSKALKKAGIQHDVLNAKNHEREARIIQEAGEPGRVTVATNMAGRGVDIVLGGRKPEPTEDKAIFAAWEERHQAVLEAGGLAVIGTERHEARRIDNQLRGRAGRQGDPGESQFYISMDDDLMRIFGGQRLKTMMERLGLPDDEPIRAKMISNSIEQAQRRVEGHNFDIRKHLVEYDDVMNQHREVVYRKRRRILELDPAKESWLHDEIAELLHDDELDQFKAKVQEVGDENFKKIERLVYLRTIDTLWVQHLMTMQHLREGIGLKGYAQKDPLVEYKDAGYGLFQRLKDEIENQVVDMLLKLKVEKSAPEPVPAQPEVPTKLELHGADERLAGGGFETVKAEAEATPTQQEPAQQTGRATVNVRQTTSVSSTPDAPTSSQSKIQVTVRMPGQKASSNQAPAGSNAAEVYPNVGRNEPCPCGSGKKFKKCHGR